MPHSRSWLPLVVALWVAGCGGDSTGPTPSANCGSTIEFSGEVGASRIIDPIAETNCVTLPGGPDLREYLVVEYSGNGSSAPAGISGSFQTRAERQDAASASITRLPSLERTPQVGSAAARFDLSLRQAERALAAGPLVAASREAAARGAALRAPPVVGQVETFNVCQTLGCGSVVAIQATVRYVGPVGAIYLDNEMPAGAQVLTQEDIDQLGTLFDDYLHPIDTTAFGATSDIDGDGHVAIVITDQVNALTPDCTDGRVVGYFFGGDLLSSYPGSNKREVFYAFAPAPGSGTCPTVTRAGALRALPPVLIHEMQHMISFNQHVLRRGGSDEVVWLNEALSHFAEELGGRLVPDARCPNSASCYSQFLTGNVTDAYLYLEDPEATHLVAPTTDGPSLAGRGAGWLFLRWLADHYSADTLKGTQLTRALLGSATVGSASISNATGQPFATLVGEWEMANWTDNLPGFPQTGRLRYRTWNLRSTFAANYPALFDRPYPLVPDSTQGVGYVHNGTLRGGSGHFFRVLVPVGVSSVQVSIAGPGGSIRVDAGLTARVAVVRVR